MPYLRPFPIKYSEDSMDVPSISEISDSNLTAEVAKSFAMVSSPAVSASSESLPLFDLTPSPKIGSGKPDSLKIRSVDQDVEFVKYFLKRTRSHSTDRDARSKKLRDELLSIILDEFYAQPEKRDRFAEFLFLKTQVVLLCFLFWILAVAMTFFFTSRVQNSFTKPLPT